MTCLRKHLDGRPVGGGPRTTGLAGAECRIPPRWSSPVLCLGPAKWALAKLGWAVFLFGWIPPFPGIHQTSVTTTSVFFFLGVHGQSRRRGTAEGSVPFASKFVFFD
ncbi:unnamed protein product [Cuscuta campestris]|uniref:Uncharacterized protein n=1 Tax=Cuscuta campestris TaxID=132261 RepID=A0A484KTY1_9ASTE|nr:unnamed protein product [Cuscuta campestris]